jgi:hypothetical protein
MVLPPVCRGWIVTQWRRRNALRSCAVFTLLVLQAATSLACPPINMHPDAVAEREREYRRELTTSKGIVYGVVEREVTSDINRKRGIFRVLHSYRGAFKAGEKVSVTHDTSGICPMALVRPIVAHRGEYGVALIKRDDRAGVNSLRMMSTGEFDRLVNEGFISSARGSRVSKANGS